MQLRMRWTKRLDPIAWTGAVMMRIWFLPMRLRRQSLGSSWTRSDVDADFSSNHFIHGRDVIANFVAFLLSAMLIHCYTPFSARQSILRPIPKNKRKSANDSANYRSIAISSLLLKLLDNIILVKHSDSLSSSCMQFGFKKKGIVQPNVLLYWDKLWIIMSVPAQKW